MILELLRARTKDLHERVERTVDLPARLRSTASYAALLARFLGFYAPLEDRLTGLATFGPRIEPAARLKAHLLVGDLTALGLSTADVLALPRCTSLPALTDASDGLGCMYVLEGATLGGQIVRREVERRFGLAPGRGCAFFGSYGERVGVMWHEFCHVLEGHAATVPGDADRIVAAAVGTFSGLERWLAEGDAC